MCLKDIKVEVLYIIPVILRKNASINYNGIIWKKYKD